jgi:tetratricopeptide (TPR) repeat protein
VPDVVQQRGAPHRDPLFVGDAVIGRQLGENPRREMKRAEAVRKARMFGSLIRKMRQTELPDTSQALKFGRVDQADEQPALVRIGFEADDVVYRIAVDLLGQSVVSPKCFPVILGRSGRFRKRRRFCLRCLDVGAIIGATIRRFVRPSTKEVDMKLVVPKLIGVLRFFAIAAVAVIAFQTAASAQSTISGIVYDKGRNPLVDLEVELQNDLYQTINRAKTDGAGRYTFGGLRNGRFFVKVYAFRLDLEDQTQEVEINTQNIRGGQGSGYFLADFYLLPRKGGLAESELGVIFAQEVPEEAKKFYEKGLAELGKKRTAEGLTAMNEAIKIFPTYFAALYRIGKELYVQQRYEECAQFMFKAVEVNPKSAGAFYYLGSSFLRLGKDYAKAALAALNQGHTLAPASMQILWALGRAERMMGDFVNAEKHLLQAKKLSGGGVPEIHKELAELYGNDLKRYGAAADELELYLKASKTSDADAAKTRKVIDSLREKAKKN